MIILGRVNIYPQAIENAFLLQVADVAVIGVPNPESGEEVKAVVELLPGVEERPRLLPTRKLYKHKLRDQYWPK